MSIGILIISVLAAMMSILGGPQNGYGIALNVLNITNTNTMDVNGAGGNAEDFRYIDRFCVRRR